MTSALTDLVRRQFAPLLEQGWTIAEQSDGFVRMSSNTLVAQFALDPRGELNVSVTPAGVEQRLGWTYSGIVGRASVERLVEIAHDKMLEDPRVLSGDAAYFAELAEERRRQQAEYNARVSGYAVPRSPGRLP